MAWKTQNICLLVALLCLVGCQRLPKRKAQQEVQAIPVKALTISAQTHACTHTYVGKIEEVSSVPLSAQTAGQITAVCVKTGDRVRTGQELLHIDDTQARNALQAAEATFQQAQDGYQRAQQVYAEGGITEQKMVEISSQLEQAKSMLAIARKSQKDCILRAPTDGVIGKCRAKAGQTIAPALPVITLLNMDGYNVVFDVAEADIATLQIGDHGAIQIPAIGQDTFPIRIVEKNLIANTIAHTYTVKAVLLGKHKHLLPGMVSKVWLQAQRVSGYFVPSECIQTLSSGKSVWVVVDGQAQRRKVETGQYVSGGVLITNGLQPGDQVIVEGFQKMYNGARVVY